MTITTTDQMIDALLNNSSRVVIDKASIANQVAGGYASLWRANGQPGPGAIPTVPAICTKSMPGAIFFNDQVAPLTSYLAHLSMSCSNAATSIEFHDRVAHMGGINATVTTQQTIGLNLHSSGLNVPADRIGDANYSDIQWWAEWYADTGATASSATVNVTYDDGTTGALGVLNVGGTIRAGRMINLNALKPVAKAANFIRSVDNITIPISTGTAGNIGFTATRRRADVSIPIANFNQKEDFVALSPGSNPNDACLFMIMLCPTTSTGAVRGAAKIAHG